MKRSIAKALALVLSLLMLFTVAPPWQALAADRTLVAGDVNLDGQVGSDDARLALRASVKLETLTVSQLKCADADQDKSVSSADARLILRASVQLETLPDVTPVKISHRTLSADELKPYQNEDYQAQFLADYYTDVADHVILDDFYEIEIDAGVQFSESQKQHFVGVGINEQNEPFFYFPDPEKMEEGTLSFQVLHFSLFGVAKLSDEKMVDLWCERAATQDVTRRISEEEITPGLREMVDDAMNSAGLGANQYGGAIVRYILAHDTRGEILTAAADGDMNTLKAKVANYAGEYVFGKVFTGEDDGILGQSMGDNAALVKKGIKDGNYAEATLEIVKNIEKNMFPAVNYADKFAALTVKLADIWANDAMNEEYENFKKLGGKNISGDDWNTLIVHMYGASHWLSQKGIKDSDLRAMFNQRLDNEAKIREEKEAMRKLVERWKDNNLLSTHYWGKSNGFSDLPPLTERLNSLRRIRESLKEMLTVNGKLKRGRDYVNLTDEDFLFDAVFQWVTNGPKNRDKFYEWLRKQGIYFDPTGEVRDYAWVLVETRVDYADTVYPTDPGDYTYAYEATPGKHSNTTSYGSGDNAQRIRFYATCTAPPSMILPGDSVTLNMTVRVTDKGKDLGLTATASARRDYPDISRGSTGTGNSYFRSTEDKQTFRVQVQSPGLFDKNPPSSATLEVFHRFGGPEDENPKTMDDGSRRIGIYFTACGAQTVWVYEWRAVE